MSERRPDTTTGRVALMCWLFANGGKYSSIQVACRLGISIQSTRRLLLEMSTWFPIYRDDFGNWLLLTDKGSPSLPPLCYDDNRAQL